MLLWWGEGGGQRREEAKDQGQQQKGQISQPPALGATQSWAWLAFVTQHLVSQAA